MTTIVSPPIPNLISTQEIMTQLETEETKHELSEPEIVEHDAY